MAFIKSLNKTGSPKYSLLKLSHNLLAKLYVDSITYFFFELIA